MVSAIDKSNELILSKADFNRAMGWLLEAEATMPDIFKSGSTGNDGKAMDEIYHFVLVAGGERGLSETKLVNFARERIPAHSVMRVVEIMERSGMIKAVALDPKTGLRLFRALTSPSA